jgi:hypothetical protein
MNGYRRNRGCGCARCRCSGYVGPAVLITLGVLFLIGEFEPRYDFFSTTWPVLLIVIGILVFLRRSAPATGHVDVSQIGPGPEPPSGGPPSGGGDAPSGEQKVTHG